MGGLAKTFKSPFANTEPADELVEKPTDEPTQPPTTRKEFISFLLYGIGNNGHSIYAYFPTLLQYVAYQGGFDPNDPSTSGCDINDPFKTCHVSLSAVHQPGDGIPVSSMVLYVQAFSFFVQFLIFITLGTLADYGRINLGVVLWTTIVFCAAQFAPLAMIDDNGAHWYLMAMVVFFAFVSFGVSCVFFLGSFPRLSDNLPVVQNAFKNTLLSKDDAKDVANHWRDYVSVLMMTSNYFGHVIIAGMLYGISFISWSKGPFISDGRSFGDSAVFIYIAIAACGGFLVICAIPYFITSPKGRQGPPFPKDANYLTFGWKSVWHALREVKKYRQLFTYTIAYFLFNDAVVTATQIMTVITGQITHFSAQEQTLIGVVFGITNLFGCVFFYYLAQRFRLPPKTVLLILVILNGLMAVYGCIGIGSSTLGFRTEPEVWVYCGWGFFCGPMFAYQQTVAALLMPKGKENMFFGMLGIATRASSWFGPLIIGAITQRTGNLWHGWPVILVMFVVAIGILYSVDMDAGKSSDVTSNTTISNSNCTNK
ncbi:autophagy-related protein 22-like protein [Chlamydoabsidia padenii]|nr:autophagy-related protein 22-like protein [Chlamydoabsidia padenii]